MPPHELTIGTFLIFNTATIENMSESQKSSCQGLIIVMELPGPPVGDTTFPSTFTLDCQADLATNASPSIAVCRLFDRSRGHIWITYQLSLPVLNFAWL